ncbi:MAG: hypothetical protein ACTSPB_06695 [Candidatus Thorarchaeota archaeon]
MTHNIITKIQEQGSYFCDIIDDDTHILSVSDRIKAGVIGILLILIDIAIFYTTYITFPIITNFLFNFGIGVMIIILLSTVLIFVTVIIPLLIGGLIGIVRALIG